MAGNLQRTHGERHAHAKQRSQSHGRRQVHNLQSDQGWSASGSSTAQRQICHLSCCTSPRVSISTAVVESSERGEHQEPQLPSMGCRLSNRSHVAGIKVQLCALPVIIVQQLSLFCGCSDLITPLAVCLP